MDSIDYTIKTQVDTDLPLMKSEFELEMKKKLPLYRIPALKLLDTELTKVGLKQN